MSRISYNEPEDDADFLRVCAFEANTKRHLKGKKGQAALKELEAALIALPEKRLVYSKFVVRHGEADDIGEVCALGALALKRCMDKGLTRSEAIKKIEQDGPDPDDEGWGATENTAEYLKVKVNFAWEVMERNDEYGGPTPEERYKRVLAWVREQIKVA